MGVSSSSKVFRYFLCETGLVFCFSKCTVLPLTSKCNLVKIENLDLLDLKGTASSCICQLGVISIYSPSCCSESIAWRLFCAVAISFLVYSGRNVLRMLNM